MTEHKPVAWWFEAHDSAYVFYPHEKERALQCARLRNVELNPLYDASLLSEYESVKRERDEALTAEYQRSNKKTDELQDAYEAQIDERDQKIAALETGIKRLSEEEELLHNSFEDAFSLVRMAAKLAEYEKANVAYVNANTSLISRAEAAEDEAKRLREALEIIEKAPAWGAPERWETTPAEVRQFAREALGARK